MSRRIVLFLAFVIAAFAASDDPWNAVTKLKSGAEIRVLKKGSMQPVMGKFDEADADRLLMVVKNEQIAIPREDVLRLDARPAQAGGRVKVESKTTTNDPQRAKEPPAGMHPEPVTGTTTTSGLSFTGKPDFETVYRRPPATPKPAAAKP
jgi:hypothetical protein